MHSCRILVVDDEAPLRAAMVDLLEQAGYDVSEAASAREALEKLQDGLGCRMVLSDIFMPGENGLALLETIRLDFPSIPVVLSSGSSDVAMVIAAFRSGAFDYLQKPFRREELLMVTARALEHAREREQAIQYRQNLEEAVRERTQRLHFAMAELERSYDVTLEAMGDALDLRDEETEGHSKRVTAYSVALAKAVGVSAAELKVIARGAFLHDIGKIATPDAILHKPARLTAEEMDIMRKHCEVGYEMVRKIPFLAAAAEIVYTHQEKFDGSGYPRGLRGSEIPLGARIFAIADTLDAMTSDRPYRKGRSFAEARAEVERCSGTQFDPRVVQAFLAIPEDTWIDIRFSVGKHSHASQVLQTAAA